MKDIKQSMRLQSMHNKYAAGFTRRACLFMIVMAAGLVFSQPAAMLEKSLAGIRAVKTLRCSIERKQFFKGVSKIAQCVFYYDGQKGKYAYIYASPYEYSFWADDSMVCGVQRGKKIGYVMRASADSLGYRSLLGSINVCSPLVQFGRTDTLRVSLKASIDDFLYFEFPAGLNREVVKIDRNRGAITLRETFDSAGAVRRQTIFEYDTTKSKNTWFPRKMIVRGNSAGAIETDTLIFTKVEIDKGIKESVFVIPAFTDIGRGK